MSLLRLSGLVGGHGDAAAVGPLDLSVGPGETVALLGPNGAGKTTLIATVSGVLRPLSGGVVLSGEDAGRLSPRRRARLVATVPQEEAFAFDFTVRQVALVGRLSLGDGLRDAPEDRAAAEDAMARADCLHLADRPVTRLSGGERQRALLARALAQDAPLLLLDEPASHLDLAHQGVVARVAREEAARGRAVVAAVHDLNLAAEIADRAWLLDRGRLVLDAPTADVLRSPELERVFGVRFARVETESGLRVVRL